ncbi:MAG: carbohydrate binding family 9 domain-containing protein, partial [Bacteroidales bacterium]|nr:carbohydrate binding family 9 domain-containing protein [Bacteroidales bacterium]
MKYLSLFVILAALCFSKIQSQKALPIAFTLNPPAIDGFLSPGEWDTSFFAGGFVQMEPDKGQDVSEHTRVYATFDSVFVYFAFVCRQGNKTPITANIQTRDRVQGSDDAVIVVLDTYLDRRSAYGFTVNPLGTQTDYKIMDDGRNINYDWDTEWYSAAVKNETGWTCELAIPFKNLKYSVSKDEWGLNFGRIIIQKSEIAWWSGEMADNYRISQGGMLQDIIVPSKLKHFMLFPYASMRYENSDITGVHNKIKPDAGGDILYTISPNLSLNATINPDFASVEGDRVKIDLSGWEVNFPEKRLFFLEGNEMFSMRYPPFYSRRIGDIGYGVKFTGKAGDYSMNVLNVRSIENLDEGQPAAFFTTARVKKDIFKSSTIGAI